MAFGWPLDGLLMGLGWPSDGPWMASLLRYKNGREETRDRGDERPPRPSTALILVPRAVVTQWRSEWTRWVQSHEPIHCFVLSASRRVSFIAS